MKHLTITLLTLLVSGSLWADSEVTPIPDLICEVQITKDELYGIEGRSETENERYSSTSEFRYYPDNPRFQITYIGDELIHIYKLDDCKGNDELMFCEGEGITELGNVRHSLILNRLSGIIEATTSSEKNDLTTGWFDLRLTTEKGACKVMPKEKKF